MRPVSARYLAAVTSSHEIVTRVTLVAPGQEGTTPEGVVLRLMDGSVTLDANAACRTSADLMVAEPWSDDGTGLAPYGQEVYVERGVVYGNGQREFVGLGYLRIRAVDQDEAPLGPLKLTCLDRMAALQDARLLEPVQFLASAVVGTVVLGLVWDVLPLQTIEWDDLAIELQPLGRSVIVEEDRWDFLDDLVRSLGKVWFFDHRGVLVIRTPPVATEPVLEVAAGRRGVLVKVKRNLDREGIFNAVVARGEGVDELTPVYAVAKDDNPDSLTYWEGPFGQVPRFYSSPFITTTAQALEAATSILAGSLGLPYEVDFSMVPNLALEPLDPVTVVYPVDLSRNPKSRREVHVLDTITVGLVGAGELVATTRLATTLEVSE